MNRGAAIGLAVCAALAAPGCARRLVFSGWARVDRPSRAPAAHYEERFSHSPFTSTEPGCAALELEPHGPVLVLVPGIRGDGEEFHEALPVLAASHPAGMFMFRWMLVEHLQGMAEDLALGISRLVACRPKEPVLVLAHSAGGVLIATAASRLQLPDDAPDDAVTIITVASPLAGTMRRVPMDPGNREEPFLLNIATHFRSYAAAPRGVQAVHLRTAWPADELMEKSGDFVPNDPEVGIPLARQIDLPPQLGHDEALVHVAWKVADGSWRAWFDAR